MGLYKRHGLKGHPIWKAWRGMKDRCLCKTNKDYPRYGGRGITICEEWVNDVETFYKWSIPNGWREGLTLDRRDNDKGYCPDNCRWTPRKEQQNNRGSHNRLLTFKGKTQTVVQWAEDLGIHKRCLQSRVWKGWSVKEILTTPVK